MAWRLSTFDGLDLSILLPELPVGSGPSVNPSIPLPHGQMFDSYLNERLPVQLPYDLAYNHIIRGDADEYLLDKLNSLKAKRGVRGKLVRTRETGSMFTPTAREESQWCYARLMQVNSTRTVENMVVWLTVDILFQIQSLWYGTFQAGGTYDSASGGVYSGSYLVDALSASLTSSGSVIELKNYGNTPNNAVRIRLRNAAAAPDYITSITLSTASTKFNWSSTLYGGNTDLEFDTGERTVRLDSLGSYQYFSLDPDEHFLNDWLRIGASSTASLTIAWASQSASVDTAVTISYHDAWE